MVVRKAALVGTLLSALSLSAQASEDYFTTDFQWKIDPRTGIYTFYEVQGAIVGDGVSGTSFVQKYGADVSLFDRVDLFVVGQRGDTDLERTNRYAFSFSGRSLGIRFHALREVESGVALTVGYQNEEYGVGPIYRNDVNLNITGPGEIAHYGFLLASKEVAPHIRVNAGFKGGNTSVGPQDAFSWNWSVGAEWEFADNWSLQGNYKQINLGDFESNHNLALRLNYSPADAVRLQLSGNLYTNGLLGVYPGLQPIIPSDYFDRFGTQAQGTIGFNASFAFGDESASPTTPPRTEAPAEAPPTNGEQGTPNAEPAPGTDASPAPAPGTDSGPRANLEVEEAVGRLQQQLVVQSHPSVAAETPDEARRSAAPAAEIDARLAAPISSEAVDLPARANVVSSELQVAPADSSLTSDSAEVTDRLVGCALR